MLKLKALKVDNEILNGLEIHLRGGAQSQLDKNREKRRKKNNCHTGQYLLSQN